MVATPINATEEKNASIDTTAPVDGPVFDETNTSWGNGSGINGDVVAIENLDDLGDFIKSIEFKATIDIDQYIRYSNLEATLATESNGTAGSTSTTLNSNWHEGDSWNGQKSYLENNNLVLEYGENTKDSWGTREFLRNIANATNNNPNSFTDENGFEAYSYVDLRRFSADGMVSNSGERLERISPEFSGGMSNPNISTTADIAIGLTPDLISEVKDLVNNSKVEVSEANIVFFGAPDYEDQYTIKVADYVDNNGKIDITKLNSENRISLDLNTDISGIVNDFVSMHGYSGWRSTSTGDSGNTDYIHMEVGDQDSAWNPGTSGYEDGVITQLELADGTEGSRVEFRLRESEITSAYSQLNDGQTLIDYVLDNGNIHIDGFEHTNLNFSQSIKDGDSEGVQVLSFDFTGYAPDTNDVYDIVLEASPNSSFIDNLTTIDFENVNFDSKLINFEADGFNHASVGFNYSLYDGDINVGNINLHAHEDTLYGSEGNNINAWINNSSVDLNTLTSRLQNFSVHGDIEGGEWGHFNVNLQYDIQTDSYDIENAYSAGWADYLDFQDDPESALENLPEGFKLDWKSFAQLDFKNLDAGTLDNDIAVALSTYLSSGDSGGPTPPTGDASIQLSYNFYEQKDFNLDDPINGTKSLSQLAVLGDSVDSDAKFVLDIDAQSLEYGYNIESTDITIQFDPHLFGTINASDIKIGGQLPIGNAVEIDNQTGTIRMAMASLSDLSQGNGISDETSLASISLNFDEDKLSLLGKNSDGSLQVSQLGFDISVNDQETIFSNTYTDSTGLLNREIVTLDDLGGGINVEGKDVTLYQAEVKLEQQGDGLVLGTERVIGENGTFTNLVRQGDTLTTSSEWLNTGNIEAKNLSYTEVENSNATLSNASFSKETIASGSFIDGDFVEDARETTTLTTDIKITGDAGKVVDLSDGIVAIQADGSSEVFSNAMKGSSNLITYQGDLNYDGRVSMKDLAYLNAGAARQQDAIQSDIAGDANSDGVLDASVAKDVDADFSGKIDIADLAVLDNDWGKSLHNGDEQFQGSSDVSWTQLDSQGGGTSWNNDSFKNQNSIEAETDYVGSLESPTSTGVIGADGNTNANDGDIQGSEFQDPMAV